MHNSTILVAGGAGFIGSYLCERLLKDGYNVLCVDNFLTGSERNIKQYKNNPKFQFILCDITDKEKLTSLIPEPVEYIYHLASPASPVQYQNHPLETLLASSTGTHNLVEIAKKNNAKFLFASTSEVYGDPLEHPQKETYWGNVNSFGPRSCYDEAKRFGEAVIYTYLNKYNVDARIIRIFNTYGPNMEINDGRVVSNFITQALQNKDITIYGDGFQTRSFCYVTDLVGGIVAAMEKDHTKGEVINLGNPDERTMKEIAEMVKRLTETSATIVFKARPADDPEKRKPDIGKAKELLGWEPTVALEDGLTKTVEYFKSAFSS